MAEPELVSQAPQNALGLVIDPPVHGAEPNSNLEADAINPALVRISSPRIFQLSMCKTS